MTDAFSAGYALIDGDIPFPNTVAITQRGAMVNALVSIYGHFVAATDSDAQIRADFNRLVPAGHSISPVSIERIIVE